MAVGPERAPAPRARALSVNLTTAAGSSAQLMGVFGALRIIGGLVNLAMPGTPAMEWAQAALGAVLFRTEQCELGPGARN